MERTKRIKTTTSASVPMFLSMSRKSKLGAPASCSRTAKVKSVATIRLLLKFQVIPGEAGGSTRVFAEIATRSGAPVPRPARPPVLLVERENHINGSVDFHGLAIEQSRLIAPLTHGIERRLLQQGMAVHDFKLLNRAVLADNGVQTHGTGNAGLARERRINRLNTVDDARGLDVATDTE